MISFALPAFGFFEAAFKITPSCLFFSRKDRDACGYICSHSIAALGKKVSVVFYFERSSFFFPAFDRKGNCVYIGYIIFLQGGTCGRLS